MMQQLGIAPSGYKLDHHGNIINKMMRSPTEDTDIEFNMPEEELERIAWETFEKLPFMDGEYMYSGITADYTASDKNGTRKYRIGVSFNRVLDGIKVLGSDRCLLYYDNSGELVEMYIELYNYEKISTLNMVPLESASEKVANPDAFIVNQELIGRVSGTFDTLRVNHVDLAFFNQYYSGCTILQPVYTFRGIATDNEGVQVDFKSRVIAISENDTYEKKPN